MIGNISSYNLNLKENIFNFCKIRNWSVKGLLLYVGQMVKTTGGPKLASSVSSPALTSGAISLLQHNLNEQEKTLWTSLGPNWTLP